MRRLPCRLLERTATMHLRPEIGTASPLTSAALGIRTSTDEDVLNCGLPATMVSDAIAVGRYFGGR